MKLSNSLNALSINTSALPSSRHLFDVIFTKIKCLKKGPLANWNYSKLLILNKFSEPIIERNS